ncbi:hypothetical protein ABZU92_18310 [Micromonospora arida]|uniref:hypothetical protein n=1 Tax=Micromonospora arida TaxID=2203715 RepID=UPI0033A2BFA3
MGPKFSRHYVAISPPVLREMTLREIHAHLVPLAPTPADERAALMAQHPVNQGGHGG